jgi:hypothetical protein
MNDVSIYSAVGKTDVEVQDHFARQQERFERDDNWAAKLDANGLAIDRERAKGDPRYAAPLTAKINEGMKSVLWRRTLLSLTTMASDCRDKIRWQQPPEAAPIWERLLKDLQPRIAEAEKEVNAAHGRFQQLAAGQEKLIKQIMGGE